MKKMLAVMGFLSLTNCNTDTYVETVGFVMLEDAEEVAIGHYIFTSTNKAEACNGAKIYIDDNYVGEITKDYTGNINCLTPPNEGKILKVAVGIGSHEIEVRFGNNCSENIIVQHSIQKGECIRYPLDK